MSPISSGRIRNHRAGVILFPGTISCFPGQNFQTMEALHIPLKINVVLQQNVNAGEWKDLVLLAKDHPLDVRFIELMPIGYGKELSPISNSELLEKLTFTFGSLIPEERPHGNGPARYYRIEEFQGSIGFISAIHGKFCNQCNRIRLTATGELKP